MADHEDQSHQHHPIEPPHGISPAERSNRDILRAERSILARLGEAVKLGDFMAILMVLATIFSAYATWRTAQLTDMIFAVADRPFLGVQQVAFEVKDPGHPAIVVNFRNFGSIAALDTIVAVHAVVDGKVVKPGPDAMSAIDAGIVSPSVPHYFHISIPPDKYQAVEAGKSNLQVHVRLIYKGPARERQLCYFERFAYNPDVGAFQASGGDDRCGTDVF